MKIEQLLMLKTVAEEGSLKAAGEKVHKTQAAISHSIKQLESHLDIQLFDRNHYRLRLTDEGEQVYQLALGLLEKADDIEKMCAHFNKGNEVSITLTFEVAFDLNIVLDTVEALQEQFPETQIIIRQEYITGALNSLDQGESDIIITPVLDTVLYQPQYESFHLFQSSVIKVAAPKLLARHPNLRSVKELQNEYQILVQDSGPGTKGVNYGVKDAQRHRYVNDASTKKLLVLKGMGWGGFSSHMIEDELAAGELKKLELTDTKTEVKLNHYAMKQRDKLLGPVASQLWESLNTLSLC